VLKAIGRPVIVGMDTRISSDMLSSAIAAGLTAAGADALMIGIVPTPAVAQLVTQHAAAAGIVISASHNPYEYNGIKYFGPDGYKLPDEVENHIETVLVDMLGGGLRVCAGRSCIGRVIDYTEGQAAYHDFLVSSCDRNLAGLRIVLDCSNGAAFDLGPSVFKELGAEVAAIYNKPNGRNINYGCGATKPESMAEAVKNLGFDIGFALDGDADRCIAADELGNVLDGDFEMAILAADMKMKGKLGGVDVVATAYSNLGLGEALNEMGLGLVTADNGDRYVLEQMRRRGLNLGGEQSGHIVMLDRSTTGDGLLTAIRIAARLSESGQKASELASVMKKYPQGQMAVRVPHKERLKDSLEIWKLVRRAEVELSGKGRVFVRASGTEPVVRIMVEAPDQEVVESILSCLGRVVSEQLA
jgi:phosphoglucosamine mutase